MPYVLETVLNSLKWMVKKSKQPSSTSGIIAGLAFLGISNPELLANTITQLIAGFLVLYSILKDDKSD
ncbi:MAG: hypothetical protein COC02_05070 [Rhodospirillaceae bacterium]|jgi:hypothetical protein|nr:MAG: hypothetical protein COC02_05070 [Rhodospirillaceae bacterium]